MAAAAGAVSAGVASRWTAVAVALAPEESSLSLEHEMQKAHAAFAAAEVAHALVALKPEVVPAVVETAPPVSSPVEAPPVPVAAAVPELTRDEIVPKEAAQADAAQSFSPVSSPSPEVVAAAVREFERVAASFEARPHAAEPVQAEAEPASVQAVEQLSQTAQDTTAVESVAEPVAAPVPEQVAAQSESESAKVSTPFTTMPIEERKVEEPKLEELKHSEPKYDEPKQEEAAQTEAKQEESKQGIVPEVDGVAVRVEELLASASEKLKSASAVVEKEYLAEEISASPTSTQAAVPVAATEPATEGTKEVAKDAVNKESEIAETTAAAWASWRRIRESGDGKSSAHSDRQAVSKEEKSATQDISARAVAAGAEKSPDDPAASSEESPEITNIVESVLADMRPRIVEEISASWGRRSNRLWLMRGGALESLGRLGWFPIRDLAAVALVHRQLQHSSALLGEAWPPKNRSGMSFGPRILWHFRLVSSTLSIIADLGGQK